MRVLIHLSNAKRISRRVLFLGFVFCLSGLFFFNAANVCAQQAADSVEKLLQVEAKVKKVVEENLNACVALSDDYGAGSGVVVTESGIILTAGHVMAGRGDYTVLFPDGRTARARQLGKNLDIDAGMFQIIDPGPWPFVEVGKSKSLNKGDWVVSLGHSGGFELGRKPPIRTGRVLGFNETQIETDAVLIGGDSGGPLFDLDGKLVGIHSSIGDSIAENRHVMMEIFGQSYQRMRRGEVWGQLPTLKEENDGSKPPKMGVVIDKESGLIKRVRTNSPAWAAGIAPGDVAIEFDGVRLNNGSHLIDLVKEKITGDVVTVKLERNGRMIEVEVRLR